MSALTINQPVRIPAGEGRYAGTTSATVKGFNGDAVLVCIAGVHKYVPAADVQPITERGDDD